MSKVIPILPPYAFMACAIATSSFTFFGILIWYQTHQVIVVLIFKALQNIWYDIMWYIMSYHISYRIISYHIVLYYIILFITISACKHQIKLSLFPHIDFMCPKCFSQQTLLTYEFLEWNLCSPWSKNSFKLRGYTVHQQYWTLFYYQLMHTTLKNAQLLKHYKLDKNAPTAKYWL